MDGVSGATAQRGTAKPCRWIRRIGLAVLVIIALLLVYVGTVTVLRSRTVTLPTPSGDDAVGRTIVTVPAGADTPDEPERAAWLWYPTDPRAAEKFRPVDSAPEGWYGPESFAPGLGWLLQNVDTVQPSARQEATPKPGRHPVVLAPGYETAPWTYTTLGEHLASHGYVVALLVPPTTPARIVDAKPRTTSASSKPPEPPVFESLMRQEAADMTALYDALRAEDGPLATNVDDRAVFAGHSLGGGAATLACERDDRCVGSINLDGPQPPLGRAPTKPELLLASETSCAATKPCEQAGQTPEHVDWLERRRTEAPPTTIATINGAGHNAFGDSAYYFVAPPLGGISGTGSIDADRMYAVLTTTLRTTADQLREHQRLGDTPQRNARDLPELEITTTDR